MEDVTKYITEWVNCCNEVWSNWFVNKENGIDEFLEIEEALFSTFVISQLGFDIRPSSKEAYKLLRAVYNKDIESSRSVCKTQKAGNTYCQSKNITYHQGMSLPMQSIDFMGTMLDGEPYVELITNNNNEYILEPLVNLKILAIPSLN